MRVFSFHNNHRDQKSILVNLILSLKIFTFVEYEVGFGNENQCESVIHI